MDHKREEVLQPLRSFGIYLSERKKALKRLVDKSGDPEILGELNGFIKIDDRFSDAFDEVVKVLNNWGF